MMELIMGMGLILFYLLPSLVAGYRKHNNQMPIFITNLLFGWTVIMWIVCLIWAASCNVRRVKAW